jgi:hypothetical protein
METVEELREEYIGVLKNYNDEVIEPIIFTRAPTGIESYYFEPETGSLIDYISMVKNPMRRVFWCVFMVTAEIHRNDIKVDGFEVNNEFIEAHMLGIVKPNKTKVYFFDKDGDINKPLTKNVRHLETEYL